METEHNIRLTSAELSSLWTGYMNNSMSSCMLQYFIATTQDTEIRAVLEYGLTISDTMLQKITSVYEKEGHPIPVGFNDKEDVNVNAPALYSDTFYLNYVHNMAKYGMTAYGASYSGSTRQDILELFTFACHETMDLYKKSLYLLLEKGLYDRTASVPIPDQVDFVEKQKYLTGWFGQRRPINATEIMDLNNDIQRNGIGKALLLGFSQTAGLQKVRDFMLRGAKLSDQIVEQFSHTLSEENVTEASTWDSEVLKSKTSPFSDKLMMFQASLLTGASVGYIGTALGTVQRRDLGAKYMKVLPDILQYAEDGANIMIDHKWLEQPPSSMDNKKMAKHKE